MKNISKLFFALTVLTGLVSCEKDENKIYFEGGTAPVLTASKTAVRLTPATENETAVVLNWTNPAFKFTTGVSSQDVSYSLELDTAGGNFTSTNKYVTSISKDLTKTFSEKELNSILGNTMGLRNGRQYMIQARVIASIAGSASTKLASNTISFTATPFAPPPKVEPYGPKVFIVGSATAGGWNNPVPANQELTKEADMVYSITMNLVGGNSYLFLPVNGSWSQKYGFDGANNTNDPMGGDFKREGGDFKAPATSGKYKITVDFQKGKFTVTPA